METVIMVITKEEGGYYLGEFFIGSNRYAQRNKDKKELITMGKITYAVTKAGGQEAYIKMTPKQRESLQQIKIYDRS